MKSGIELIAQERKEQIEKHDRTIEEDVVKNCYGQLREAAQDLITNSRTILIKNHMNILPIGWNSETWSKMCKKPYRERLIIAGALIAAEIDRIQFDEKSEKMKALTIKQPWASLIVQGIKNIENRTWKTNFRGRIYIHAGSLVKHDYLGDIFTEEQFNFLKQEDKFSIIKTVKLSAIIGEVDIIDCVQNHSSIWAEKGVWNWVLSNPVLYDKPIENVKGKLSLWEFEIPEKTC